MSEYFINEDGDEEFGFTWDLYRREGDRIIRVATFYGEFESEHAKDALQWYETLDNEGKVSIPKKAQRALKIVFEPSKPKAKR